jgi:cytochrome d ubiquinol oxidase subunit II
VNLSHETLQIIWFLLVGVLLIGYAILDGFDLGVGMHLIRVKDDRERRVLLNSIGPVWDGNEVWLVVGGGALFAAFPNAYATVFSGFYLPFMLLLFALIFRAVAIEFRSKRASTRWRHGWDVSFCVSSFAIALLMGVALGNMVIGVPLDARGEYVGGFFNLLTPYPLLLGLTAVALFYMHGAIYLSLKVDESLQERVGRWVRQSIAAFVAMFAVLTVATLFYAPYMKERFLAIPLTLVLPVILILAILDVPREIHLGKPVRAFFQSSVAITCLMGLFGLGTFPTLVRSEPAVANSLTIYNASASDLTLTVMLIMAILGLPFVLAYTIAIYKVFGGRISSDVEKLHY